MAGALFFDHVLLRRYPESERQKGPVTEPGQLAEERPEGFGVGHGHVVRG